MDHTICPIDELADGTMRQAEWGEQKVLVARIGGRCHAVGATCPHAGGPLAEGVLRPDGVVVCPWHKAAFQVATGALVEPPALDALPTFPVRVEDGEVVVSVGAEPERVDPARASLQQGDGRRFVVIGTGAAGAMAAQTLREAGFTGRVVMVGREDRLPYDRTVLSKYALSGKQGAEKTPLQDAGFYERHGIERRVGEVVQVDPAAREIRFEDGGTLAYDAALLATGGVPRRLEVPGASLAGVFTLRSPADAEAIVAAAERARHAVVIGGGYIGLEAAASLRERGLDVTVVMPQAMPLQKQLGAEVGAIFRRVHEGQGIRFRTEAQVVAVEGDGRVRQVALDDGTRLPADLVLAGLGISPATALLPQSVTRREDGGLDVDAGLRVVDGLYAAGDIAGFPLRGDGERVRVEHWRVAEQHGRLAALNMLGRDLRYDAVPVFWTIQFMKRLDYVGHAEAWDEVVLDGDLQKPSFTATYVRGGQVAAVAGWDRDKQMAAAIGLLTEQRTWSPSALSDALRRWAD